MNPQIYMDFAASTPVDPAVADAMRAALQGPVGAANPAATHWAGEAAAGAVDAARRQVAALVGDNSLKSNLVASVVGCLFYFATLTEIPILQALMEHGMHKGPALALLLAGPALSLPSLLVIRSVIGNKKTAVFTFLVVVMATIVGTSYGSLS